MDSSLITSVKLLVPRYISLYIVLGTSNLEVKLITSGDVLTLSAGKYYCSSDVANLPLPAYSYVIVEATAPTEKIVIVHPAGDGIQYTNYYAGYAEKWWGWNSSSYDSVNTRAKGDVNSLKLSNTNNTTRYYFERNEMSNLPADIGSSGIIEISNFGNFFRIIINDSNSNMYCLCIWNVDTITPESWRKL